jgi:hypothetical protein
MHTPQNNDAPGPPLGVGGTALDLLEYEDRALLHVLDEFEAEEDRLQHGMLGRLFVEHLAVRQAARESVADRLADVPAAADLSERLEFGLRERRTELARLDEMGRGMQPINLNQGQDFDGTLAPIARTLRDEIGHDLADLIPALRSRIPQAQLKQLLAGARRVRRHAPTHPHPRGRRGHERFAPLVRLHALYDWLRDFPRNGLRPSEEVHVSEAPGAERQRPAP